MDSLTKINTVQLYQMWKNLSISLLVVILMMTLSKLLPSICSPLVALGCAAYLYTAIYNSRRSERHICVLISYTFFISLLSYAFLVILANLFDLWKVVHIPPEFVFFSSPFIPSLILNPVCLICVCVIYIRRKHLHICTECKLARGASAMPTSRMGSIYTQESYLQLRNLIGMFGILSVVMWTYYIVFYTNINANARDWYIFTWFNVIVFLLDEVYFLFRYYNLYLDLKENNEIISEDEIANMSASTYVRYYVICDNNVYVDPHAVVDYAAYREVIDTPFQTLRSVNGVDLAEVKRIITQMTGISDGELRFFFGRKSPTNPNHSLLRYFYFVKPLPDGSMPALRTDGEWMDYKQVQKIYSTAPGRLAPLSVHDTTRLATIMLTEKVFDENGYRKTKLKRYNPTYDLIDVRKSTLDFQDDKWIRISLFNSDTPFFRFKRLWRRLTRSRVKDRRI